MPEEKKSRYTEAQKRAAEKYLKESVEDIRIRVPKGQKSIIKEHAETQGESMNAFVVRAIDETMNRDQGVPKWEVANVEQVNQRSAEQDNQESEQAEPKESALKHFTDAERKQIDYKRLLSDVLYQFSIMKDFGSTVLADLLEQARAGETPAEQDDTQESI